MKKNIIITIMLLCISFIAAAQHRGKDDWKQKMMSEKIAFFTTEIGITPEEAQIFWPVYNQIHEEKDKAMHELFKAYKELSDAVEAGKSGKELQRLLEAYLLAQKKQRDIDTDAPDKIKKVLPVEKIARLYLAEEKFRRQMIHKLNHSGPQKKD